MPVKIGLNGKLYRLSSGTRSSWGTVADGIASGAAPANLDEIDTVQDVTITLEKEEADVTTRANNGWMASVGTLKKATLEFNLIYDSSNTDHQQLFASFQNGTPIALAVLDGDKTEVYAAGPPAVMGTQGVWADWEIVGFNKTESLKDAQKVAIKAVPTFSTVGPQWVKVTAP